MTITLMPLPYAKDALTPYISQETLELHHGAHHKAYVDKTNAAIKDSPLSDADLNTIVQAAAKNGDEALFNNAAQAWNHGFYWHSLSPEQSQPDDVLGVAIERDFGSLDGLREELSREAVGHFASGWAWLVAEGGRLKVISTHDADTPITGNAIPLLTIDVWEHAYYVDARNKRDAYVKAVTGNLLNWRFASENYARETAWQYPS